MLYDLEGVTHLKSSLLEDCYSRKRYEYSVCFHFVMGSYEPVTQRCNRMTPAVGSVCNVAVCGAPSGSSCRRDVSAGRATDAHTDY